ncbi:unnamed protein product [Calicophoron daubneyi]|uniref:Galectin domain-containing protein n=1 Tax=Calicophoron daubneyi TaxID=300641 RepID=A0AAV2TBQ7_CALDB
MTQAQAYSPYNGNMSDVNEEDLGPIIQPIPDNLMVGDYIEIAGYCRGKEVLVELLTSEEAAVTDTDVLPLQVRLQSGGPVRAMNRVREKIQRQEKFVENGVQENLAFKLCIYANETCYEIRLNDQHVCNLDHLVRLEDVSAISMDGDAEFTSIEFKDIYGEDEPTPSEPEKPEAGMMRIAESRQSFQRHKSPPVFVRTSTRRSSRRKVRSPLVDTGKPATNHWPTSNDLSRPNMDIDTPYGQPVDNLNASKAPVIKSQPKYETDYGLPEPQYVTDGSRNSIDDKVPRGSRGSILPPRSSTTLDEKRVDKQLVVGGPQSRVVAGSAHRGSYSQLDDETQQPITYTSGPNAEQKPKSKSAWPFGKKTSTPDLTDSERGSKRSIRDWFKRKKSTGSSSNLRGSASLGNLSYPDTPRKLRLEPGVGAATSPVLGGVSKEMMKEPAATIAGHIAAQKAVPEFENFTLTPHPEALPTELERMRSQPAPTVRSSQDMPGPQPTTRDQPMSKSSGPAAELANRLYDEGRAGFNPGTTLTGNITEPIGMAARTSTVQDIPPKVATTPITPAAPTALPQKLKGTAPEIASKIQDTVSRPNFDETTLISPTSTIPASNITLQKTPQAPPVDVTPRSPMMTPTTPVATRTTPMAPVVAPIVAPVATPTQSQKLKGTAPEIASKIQDTVSRPNFDETTLISPTSTIPASNITLQKTPQAPPVDMTPRSPMMTPTTPVATRTTPMAPVVAPIVAPAATPTQSQKLKGPAPEIASKIQDTVSRPNFDDTTLMSPTSTIPASNITLQKTPQAPPVDVTPRSPMMTPTTPVATRTTPMAPVVTPVVEQPIRRDEAPTRIQPPVYEKPYIDTDYELPTKTELVRDKPGYMPTMSPPKYHSTDNFQRSMSDDRMSHGSDVYSDGEYYLDVGKSAYYHERCQSLKRHKSRRTVAKDREARRSLGLALNHDSTRSSISSITADELREMHGSDYRRSEPLVNPTRAAQRKLYTAAPSVDSTNSQSLTVGKAQLIRDEFAAELPVRLSVGRCMCIRGHFLYENEKAQTCSLRIGANEPVCANGYDGLLLEYGIDGTVDIFVLAGSQKIFWGCMKCPVGKYTADFNIELHVRAKYLALTVSDFVSQMMPKPIDLSLLTFVRLEPGSSAELDGVTVFNHFELPLELTFADSPCRNDFQTLSLATRLYADTQSIILDFTTQAKKTFSVVFDFLADRLYVMAASTRYTRQGETEIPFVPEQIRSIHIKRNASENCLCVCVNGRQLLVHTVPVDRPVGKLSTVRILGDFTLLKAKVD